jgi:putative ABC transport system permease protein
MDPTHHFPPLAAQRFLLWFLRDELAEEVQGDLDEQFYSRLGETSLFRTKLNYWYQVFNYLRPFAISRSSSALLIQYAMFRNYFKISIRSLYKQKLYSAINIGGLAVGLTCFILIFLFVQHELSYDRTYENADQIYRIYQRQPGNVYLGSDYFGVTPAPLASALTEEFPEVKIATAIQQQSALLGLDDEHQYMEEGIVAGAHFFDLFVFQFLKGNVQKALENPKSIVLTRKLSHKLFGDKDPVGTTLIFQNDEAYTVTGVINDPPENLSFKFSFVASLPDYYFPDDGSGWTSSSVHTFFMLAEDASPGELLAKLPALIEKHRDAEKSTMTEEYLFQRLKELHLQSKINFDIGLKGNSRYVLIFSAIALIVLLLACANYMNLAVARSVSRAHEVGMRKVVGAVRKQLIGQFLGESVLITFLALLLALGMTWLLLPAFGTMVERPIELNFTENRILIPGLLVLVMAVGLVSGSYPALFISSLSPYQVLKGNLLSKFSGFSIKRWLIVGQYVVTIILVTGSIVIQRQLDFMQNKELGYDREHVMVVTIQDPSLSQNYETLRDEWLQNPRITAVTASGSLPTNINSSTRISFQEAEGEEAELLIYENRVHYNFLDVFGIGLVAGRDFSPEIIADIEEGYVINESAALAMGWTPEEAIGNSFTHQGEETVIGVIRDFNMHSLHLPIQALMFRLHDKNWRYISVKLRPEDLSETIAMLEKSVKDISPYPFEYQFLDERVDQLYKTEMKLGDVLGFFTILSILIGSLGIFGMAAFTTEQRTREIGIRKVMGASVRNILVLLSKDFIKLVVLSCFIAFPLAWYAIYRWLQEFAYRIDIEWWIFALSGSMVLLIAYIAIGKQSIKAALVNPVDSLGSE